MDTSSSSRPARLRASALLVALTLAISAVVTEGVVASVAAAAPPPNAYRDAVLADLPAAYYRFSEAPGATVSADSSGGGRDLTDLRGPTFGGVGAMTANTDPSVATYTYLDPGSLGRPAVTGLPSGDSARTVEGWIRTTSKSNQHVIAKWGDYAVGVQDQNVVVTAGGQVTNIPAGKSLADGRWHLVHLAYSPGVYGLFVDGIGVNLMVAPAANTPTTADLVVAQTNSWTTTNEYDDIAIYPGVVGAARAEAHYAASGVTRPSAPASVTATAAANGSATVSWPASTASVPSPQTAVEHYVVTTKIGTTVVGTVAVPGTATSVVVSGLAAGSSYTFSVYGHNGFGDGAAGVSAAVAGLGASPYPVAVRADAPALWYRFGEPAGTPIVTDSSGFGRHGIESTRLTTGETSALAGQPDSAAKIGAYVELNRIRLASVGGLPSADTARSVEGWVKTAKEGSDQTIASWGDFAVNVRDRSVRVTTAGTTAVIDAPYKIVDGAWHHIVVTYASPTITAYVDGVAIGTAAAPAALATATPVELTVAGNPGWESSTWFDEVAIYPTALSAARVAAHFTASGDQRPTAPGAPAATPGANGTATITWTAAGAAVPPGQTAVDAYLVTAYSGTTAVGSVAVPAGSTSAAFKGLANATAYTFRITGRNSFGLGASATTAAITATGTSTYANTVRGDNPAAWYRLSEPAGTSLAADSSASGRHALNRFGTVTAGETGALANSDDKGASLWTYLDNSHLKRLATTGLPAGDAARSVEGWIKTNKAGAPHTIAAWGGFSVSVQDQVVNVAAPNQATVSIAAPDTIVNDRWHQVIVTYATPTVRAYVDGILIGTGTFAAPLTTDANTDLVFAMAAGWQSTTWYDEISVFPTALTAAKVTAHFNASGDSRPSAPGAATATVGPDGTANLTWNASTAGVPAGQVAVEGYTVTAYSGTTAVGSLNLPGTTTSTVFSGLTNGTSYTFKITGRNGFGTGATATTNAITAVGSSAYAVAVKADNPAAYYRFSEPVGTTVAGDSSTANRPATDLYNVTFGAAGALAISPPDPAVSIWTYLDPGRVRRIPATGLPAANTARTVEGWINTAKTGSTHQLATWGGYAVGVRDRYVTVNAPGLTEVAIPALTTITDGKWHHVVATYNGTTVAAYVDGLLIGSAPLGGTLTTAASSDLQLGVNPGWEATDRFDEIAVFPTALSAAAVTAHFNASGDSRPSAPGAPTASAAAGGAASITWNASTAGVPSGQVPVEEYTVTALQGSTVIGSLVVPGTTTSTTFTGLTNGTTYTFRITGKNGFGTGAPATTNSIVATGSSAYAVAVKTDNPAAYYRFSEPAGATVAADSSVNLRHATERRGITAGDPGALITAPDNSIRTYAFVDTGYVRRLASTGLPAGNGARTVEGFVKTGKTGGTQVLASWGDYTVGVRDGSVVVNVAGQPEAVFHAPGYALDGQWHHVVVTYASQTLKAYLDGLPLGSATLAAPLATATNTDLYMAMNPGWDANANFDEIAIYPTALSETRIAAHVNATGRPLDGPTGGVGSFSLGTPQTGALTANQSAWFAVNLTAGRDVKLTNFTAPAGAVLTLRDPNGFAVQTATAGQALPGAVTVPYSGRYSIEISGNPGATAFTLADNGTTGVAKPVPSVASAALATVPRTVIGSNNPFSGAGWAQAGEVDSFRFSGSSGEVVHLGAAGPCSRDVKWNLRDPSGRTVFERRMSTCSLESIRLKQTGTYILDVTSIGEPGEYQIEIWRNALLSNATGTPPTYGSPALTWVTPTSVGTGGSAKVDIVGRNIPPGSTARVVKGATTIPIKGQKLGADPSAVDQVVGHVVLDTRTAPAGTYDLIVRLPSAVEVTLTNAITITTPSAPSINVAVQGPDRLRIGQLTREWVTVTNPGNRDLYGVPVTITVAPSTNCTLAMDIEEWRAAFIKLAQARNAPASYITMLQTADLSFLKKPTRGPDGMDHFDIHIPYLPTGQTFTIALECVPNAAGSPAIRVDGPPLTNPYNVSGPPTGQLPTDSDPYLIGMVDNMAATHNQNGLGPVDGDAYRQQIADELEAIVLGPDEGLVSLVLNMLNPEDADWGEFGLTMAVTALEVALTIAGFALAPELFAVLALVIAAWIVANAVNNLLNLAFKPILQALGFDPNDVVGPAGVGTPRWIRATDTRAYTVRFENYSTAQLPVQHVRVNEQLDSDLDWSTFTFTSAKVAGTTIALSGSADHVSGSGSIPYQGGTPVTVDGTINRATGRVTWTIAGPPQLDDPYQPSPYGDFLAPNVTSPEGEGELGYTIKPRADVPHGQTIDAKADITFDEHASGGSTSSTPVWTNTIDKSAPTATVAALPASSPATFNVSWSGSDVGSGLKDYVVRVKVDGGAWTAWLSPTALTTKAYVGAAGHTYSFCATARDKVLLAEPTCSVAEATTVT